MPPRTRATAKPVEPPRERPVKARRWRTPREVADGDPFAPESNAVYRLYNGVGALLYVGISDHPKRRFGDHSDGQPWWGEVARWEVRWTASRALALAEEARAIRDEVPAFNIAGVPPADDAVDPSLRQVAQLAPPCLHGASERGVVGVRDGRVAAETFAGVSGLLCDRTEIPVHDCDCHSRHVVSAFEERRFGLPMGAPFGVEARPWQLPVKHRVLAALRRYVA